MSQPGGQWLFGVDERGKGRLNFQPQMKHGWITNFFKPVRAGIVVASPATNGQSSVRSDIIGMWTEDAAPTGLKIVLVLGSTNMPRLTALGKVWETVFGATPKTATGTGALPSQVPAVRPMAVWGGRMRVNLILRPPSPVSPGRPTRQLEHPFSRGLPGRSGEKSLQICGAGRKSRTINKEIHASRGQENNWKMSDQNKIAIR
jgi:hypothetical protein